MAARVWSRKGAMVGPGLASLFLPFEPAPLPPLPTVVLTPLPHRREGAGKVIGSGRV